MDEITGRIFDIQRYSIHDGPGVRTVVFFKGCALRCRWCCNPESQSFQCETMLKNGEPTLIGRDVTVNEVLETVLRDVPYYRRSGGGMTLSGGEFLLQPDFAQALLSAAKTAGLHTAVETTGFATVETIERVLPYIDLVMMDIKHTDSEKHKAFCGQPNERILANADTVARKAKELIVRVPVIPGFNDTEADIRSISRFVARLPNVRHLHLLPYHRLGQDKYTALGRPYSLDGILPPDEYKIKALLSVACESGLLCQIGG